MKKKKEVCIYLQKDSLKITDIINTKFQIMQKLTRNVFITKYIGNVMNIWDLEFLQVLLWMKKGSKT